MFSLMIHVGYEGSDHYKKNLTCQRFCIFSAMSLSKIPSSSQQFIV